MKKTITLDDSERRIYLFKTGSAELVDANPFEGIKLLGRGEFVVPPATIGDKKAACRFVAGRAPGEIRLAAAPEWLSPAFRSPTTEPLRAKAMEVRRIRIDDILVDEDDRRELDEAASKSSASGKPADTTIPPAAGRPATVPETVSRDETAAEIEQLKAELAEKTEKLRQTENELRQARLAASRASERAVTSPSSVPTHSDDDLDIPAYLDRRPLSAEEKKALAALDAAWSNAPAIVRERFIAILRTVADAQDRFPTAL